MTDTIYAPATAPGQAGVAVVRVSGPAALTALAALAYKDPAQFPSHRMTYSVLKDPASGVVLDKTLCVCFKGPKSFTGEDVAELHLHGGHAVVQSVLSTLSRMDGLRLAEPGEFTRRAFENGKMDLTEAEAVADLIAAETEEQQRLALDQLGGSLSRLYTGWAERLKNALAHQEADIEFPDEDMPDGVSEAVRPVLDELISGMTSHLDDHRRGERLRSGITIAVVGAPNAGKSSLVNALAERDVAIVSDIAGTTRDVIEVHLNLGGYPVIVLDTAGLRRALDDEIEAEGIKRALERAAQADFKIAVFDTTRGEDADTLSLVDEKTVVVWNKSDLQNPPAGDVVRISAKTGEGVEALLTALLGKIQTGFSRGAGDGPMLTRTRHREALKDALAALKRAENAELPEMSAEDMRLALRAIGRITGRVDVEDLLDVIFRDFCIGK